MKVACGIMYDNAGKILMGLRNSKGSHPSYWEFPGGKCEKDESLEECLHREWYEELNIGIEIEECIHISTLDFAECHFFVGKISNLNNLQVNVHEYIGFYDVKDLKSLRLFEGDEKIVDMLVKRNLQTT